MGHIQGEWTGGCKLVIHRLVRSVFVLPAQCYKNLIQYFKTEILGYNLATHSTGLGDRLNV